MSPGYQTVAEVDRALMAQVRFHHLMRSAQQHVAPELQAVCVPDSDSLGHDALIDELLEARLRITRMTQTRVQAMKKLGEKVAQTRVQ